MSDCDVPHGVPSKCPITGADFFMIINHPDIGDIATYGGPYDSYTIPERISDGTLELGLTVVDDDGKPAVGETL